MDGLFSGAFTNHESMKFLSRGDTDLSGTGASCVATCQSIFMGAFLSKGGDPSHNSMATMPRDQISTPKPYSYFSITSGAIQHGVPRTALRVGFSAVSCVAIPKSPILTVPNLLIIILSDFISLCTLYFRCK